jgi:hypothetical protein
VITAGARPMDATGALDEAGSLVAVDGDSGIVSVVPALEPSGTSSAPDGEAAVAMV